MTGLRALATLDGGSPASTDLLTLDLVPGPNILSGPGFAARADDRDPAAVSLYADEQALLVFLGELHAPQALAALLDCPPNSAAIAAAALRRWGPRTMDHLRGDWTILCRMGADIWLGASRRLRDHVHFVHMGDRLAIAGNIRRLAALPWVGESFDPQGLAYALGRAKLRERGLGTTVLRHIFRLLPGELHRFSRGGVHEVHRHAPDMPIPWRGSFEQALMALEEALRRVTRRMLSGHAGIAILLSGGLDSALVAWLVAEERAPGQKVVCLTAVAPPGSPHPDERDLAASVARHLGLDHHLVWPDADARIYRPKQAVGESGNPSLAVRHYSSDALLETAQAHGATALVTGIGGEMGVTRRQEAPGFAGWLRAVRTNLRWVKNEWKDFQPWRVDAYHVRLSPRLLATLPKGFAGRRQTPPFESAAPAGKPMGFLRGYHKAWQVPTVQDGMQYLSPLHDPEIVAMVAGMPPEFASHGGLDRALAREILKGRLPEHVRLQPKGRAFSVDYEDRLKAEAGQIAEMIPAWRAAGADAWLDLDWLSREADRMAAGEITRVTDQFRVQITALTAEYFRQWTQARNR